MAQVDMHSWEVPPIFRFLAEKGQVSRQEMYRIFNMGIGMVFVVSESEVEEVIQAASELGEKAYHIGQIVSGDQGFVFTGGE
jgi:phosphoribosylformylglycinamidine cyclo-ligase